MLLLAVTDGQMDRQKGELVAQMMNITFDGRMEGLTAGQQTDSGQTKGWTNGPKDK